MKNKYWVGAVIAVVILVLIGWFLHNKGSKSSSSTGLESQNNNTTSPSSTQPVATPTPPNSKASNNTNISYNQALQIYGQNGHRIQFTQCHGTPGLLVIKQGSKYMLDN